MASAPSAAVATAIQQAAAANGVPLPLALAVAYVESGFNPNASGDSGHSIGLYQLNDQGEGAEMTLAQKTDPLTNANKALSEIGAMLSAHPGLDLGQIAAMAQRPADPAGYAARVDSALSMFGGGSSASSSSLQTATVSAANDPTAGLTLDPVQAWKNALTQGPQGFADGVAGAAHDVGVNLRNSAIGIAAGVVVALLLLSRAPANQEPAP